MVEMTPTPQELLAGMRQQLHMGAVQQAISTWKRLYEQPSRDPYLWIQAADLFLGDNSVSKADLREIIFPQFNIVVMEVGARNIWLYIALARMAFIAELYSICVACGNYAINSGAPDSAKYHLIRCIFLSYRNIQQYDEALKIFLNSFRLLPLCPGSSLPVGYTEAADICGLLGRSDWADALAKSSTPDELIEHYLPALKLDITPPNVKPPSDSVLSGEPEAIFDFGAPITLNGLFPVTPDFGRKHSRPQVKFYELKDVTVICNNSTFVFFDRNEQILTHISNTNPNEISKSGIYELLHAMKKEGRIAKIGLGGFIRDRFPTPNICHFLLDQLSRLHFFTEAGVDLAKMRLVGPDMTAPFQFEAAAMLGLDKGQFLPTKDTWSYQFKTLFVPDNVGATHRHPAHLGAEWALDYLRNNLRQNISPPSTRADKIFISREFALGRRFTNESDVQALLRSAGYAVVHCEKLSFAEQVSTFYSASHVIGPHGAGLTNIVFCEPEAKILEVFHPNYGSDAYFYTALGSRLDYNLVCDASLSCEAFSPDRSYIGAHITAPLDEIRRWLDSAH